MRTVAQRAGVDRKNPRSYVQAAQTVGLDRAAGLASLTDDLLGAVIEAVWLVGPNGHGSAWETLLRRRQDISGWVGQGLSMVKIHDLLTRSGTIRSSPPGEIVGSVVRLDRHIRE